MRIIIYLPIAFLTLTLISCEEKVRMQHHVDIAAVEYGFEAPDTIEAGWTTFHLSNEGSEEHFMLISSISDSLSLDEFREVATWRKDLRDAYVAGVLEKDSLLVRLEEGMPALDQMKYQGGVGILSPEQSASFTNNMQPGRYVLQCYVRNQEGASHDELGMMHEMVVKPSEAITQRPTANKAISIRNTGISYPGQLPEGINVVQLYFEQQTEKGFRGNDIHIYKLKDGYTVGDVKEWIDIFEERGLMSPAPAIFVGGGLEMPKSARAYVTVDLEPGVYFTVSEKDFQAPGTSAAIVVK